MAALEGSTDGPLQASALEGPASHSTGPMSNSQLAAGSALRTLIGQKEKELHDMNEYRIQALEGAIAERDRQILELRENFKKLKVDFQYNLQLIEDRDTELQRYDSAFANLKNVLRDRDAEISDLKVSIDELEAQVRSEHQRSAQVEGYCKDKLDESKARLEGLRLQKDEELRKTKADMDEMRRTFLAQLGEKDELLNAQRRDMSNSFDELSRKQDAEARAREETLQSELREAQLKDGLLLKEKGKLEQELDELRRTTESLRAQIGSKDLQLAETLREQEIRVGQLRREIEALQAEASDKAHDAQDKANRLWEAERDAERDKVERARTLAEMKETMEVAHRRALQDQEKALRELIHDAEARCETLGSRLATAESERQRYLQTSTRTTREMQEQEVLHLETTQALQRKIDAMQTQVEEASRSAGVQRAMLEEELAAAREKIDVLKRGQDERRQDIEALRSELQSAAEREEALQRQVAQIGLRDEEAAKSSSHDADKEAENQVQQRFSELLKSIGHQRDRAIAEKDLLQSQLNEALKQLQQQRQDKGNRPAGLHVENIETDTPLDSPIQMPPFPATPVPHNHNLSSRPTTADTDMWRSRPTTAEGGRPATRDGGRSTRPGTAEGDGGSTRPATAEGVREAAENVGRVQALDMSEQASHAVAEAHRLRVRLGEVEEQNSRLRSVVAQMRSEMERMTSGKTDSTEHGAREEKEVLLERLRQTEAVLRRVTAERDKLISISNMLRAELKRAQGRTQLQRGPLREVQSSKADLDALDLHGDDHSQYRFSGCQSAVGRNGGVREAWSLGSSKAGRHDEGLHGEAEAASREMISMEGGSEIEMVELAMAELVQRNRQMKIELAQMPGHRRRSGVKYKDGDKAHNRAGGSSSETGGLISGIHAYSQAEGGWEAIGSAGGVRKKLERVRESLCLAGHSTAVKDRPGLVGNSERTTHSQSRALTRVALKRSKPRNYVREDL